MTTVGRRLPDTLLSELPEDVIRPGDYWKVIDESGEPLRSPEPTNLTGTVWMIAAPLGGDGFGLGTLMKHTVREHEDGTISVRAGDGSSNSILVTRGDRSFHGYIARGVWSNV